MDMKNTAWTFTHWHDVPVQQDDRLALNVLVRETDRIRLSHATWLQLLHNGQMRKSAQSLSETNGIRSIRAVRDIPGHRVGQMFHESQTLLAEYAEDITDRPIQPLRDEIAALRALLDEVEGALDTALYVQEVNRQSILA